MIIYKTPLMSPNDAGLLAYVEDNYDRDQLTELIYDTQELNILPIIGTGLYDELTSQIRGSALTSLNQTLISKINPCLKWFVLAEGMHIFTYKIRNKGVVTQSSDNAQPATLPELNYLIKSFENNAQVYADRLMRYLMENESSYPLYYDPGDGIDTIRPKRDQFNSGWVLGNKNKYNPCCNGGQNEIKY